MADAGRQRDGAIVPEQIAEERVEDRIVDLRLDDALAQVIQDDDLRHAATRTRSTMCGARS